ncbi:hypothetical protein ACIQCJ_00440 [Streptomyces sp. NPDC093221]|uniref:hypothetical protein n=1 Tax=Streptomyces sp. NPDC093221 TaxID=3366032 RepID=UPI00381E9386
MRSKWLWAALGAAVVVSQLAVNARPRAAGESDEAVIRRFRDDPGSFGTHSNSGSGGYRACGHDACSKKAKDSITSHDCCGRCRMANYRDCAGKAMRDYYGPGSFYHDFHDGIMQPGVCTTCGEPQEAH